QRYDLNIISPQGILHPSISHAAAPDDRYFERAHQHFISLFKWNAAIPCTNAAQACPPIIYLKYSIAFPLSIGKRIHFLNDRIVSYRTVPYRTSMIISESVS